MLASDALLYMIPVCTPQPEIGIFFIMVNFLPIDLYRKTRFCVALRAPSHYTIIIGLNDEHETINLRPRVDIVIMAFTAPPSSESI